MTIASELGATSSRPGAVASTLMVITGTLVAVIRTPGAVAGGLMTIAGTPGAVARVSVPTTEYKKGKKGSGSA